MIQDVQARCQDLYFRHIKKNEDMHLRSLTHFGHGICVEVGKYPARGLDASSNFVAQWADPVEEIEYVQDWKRPRAARRGQDDACEFRVISLYDQAQAIEHAPDGFSDEEEDDDLIEGLNEMSY